MDGEIFFETENSLKTYEKGFYIKILFFFKSLIMELYTFKIIRKK